VSDIGLHSPVYAQTRELAELVDSVLVELRLTGGLTIATEFGNSVATVAKETRLRLGRSLLSLAGSEPADLSTRLLSLLLEQKPGISPGRLREAGEALLQSVPNPATVAILDDLARALEQEHAQSSARLRTSPR
jgi:hypothetical protein